MRNFFFTMGVMVFFFRFVRGVVRWVFGGTVGLIGLVGLLRELCFVWVFVRLVEVGGWCGGYVGLRVYREWLRIREVGVVKMGF